MIRNRSRLYRKIEEDSKRNLILSIIGSLIVIFALAKFGVPLLANFAFLLSGNKDNVTSTNNRINFVSPPLLNPLPEATNSAKLKLTGKADTDSTIELYLNDDLTDKTETDKNGSFSFDIRLIKGDNKVYAKERNGSKISDKSDEFKILFKDTPPTLTIKNPSDGQKFSGDRHIVAVDGTTDDPSVKVTINGFWSIVDQSNKFSYQFPLQNGDNQITVDAVDQAGNKTEKTVKVNYSP